MSDPAMLNSRLPSKQSMTANGPHTLDQRESDSTTNDPMDIDPRMDRDLTKKYQDYALSKVDLIFPNDMQPKQKPNMYQQEVAGAEPTVNPLLANLNSVKNTYTTPLPKVAYERQIDVNSKYVRQGHYMYGA